MKINAIERMFVNNPIRQFQILKNTSKMKSWFPDRSFDDVLEIGCGFGAGILAIDQALNPKTIHAFDLDPRMVNAAARRGRSVQAALTTEVADSENIPYADASFDAVFELTIFHHIPNWQGALEEVTRVLRPGGVFFFEELTREFHFDLPVFSFFHRRLTDHPWDTIPNTATFRLGIEKAGLNIIVFENSLLNGWITGAAIKSEG